jgi:hypothetical protein
MLSISWYTVVILSIVVKKSEANVVRENTVFELAVLVSLLAEGVAGVPSMVIGTCLLATVCDEHNGEY